MQRRQLVGLLLTALAGGACGSPHADRVASVPGETRTREEARARLAALADRYQELMRQHGLHEWSRYAGKLAEGPATQRAMERLRAEERDLFLEADRILTRFGDRLLSPRRAELWRRGALGLKLLGDPRSVELSDQLEGVINGHRFLLDGKQLTHGEISEMRRSEDANARRRTRQLEHGLHVAAAPIATALLARRRELARELGQKSFYSAMLEVRGADVGATQALLGTLFDRTRRPFGALMADARRALGRVPAPWDLDFALKRLARPPDERFPKERALESVYRVYRTLGIDLERSKLGVTVRDFAFGGQTIALAVPDDVRLVVRSVPGARYYGLLLHELGHAFAVVSTRAQEPLYKGYEWVPGLLDPAFAEGVAEVFGRLLDEPRVLTELLGLSAEEAAELVRARRNDALVSIRRQVGAAAFERAALERPDAKLDELSLTLERQHGGTFLPRDAEPVWATSAFLATYPVYTQSYALAAAVAVQVREALRARFGERWLGPETGRWLTERLVADGTRLTLREKLIRTTGSPLDPNPLLRFAMEGRTGRQRLRGWPAPIPLGEVAPK